ncbi:MAG: prolipoprotein diacylglyceryl transferase [Ruminococcus sp.]|nr:prolipoprotein diacylglyceryl transferase [Ruminococcus sp.]
MYPYINVFSFELPTYGLISLLGVLAAGLVSLRIIKKRNVDVNSFLVTAIAAAVGLFIGAHLLYGITRIADIAEAFREYSYFESFFEFLKYLSELFGGMVFYGGLYGGLITGYLWAKHKKYNVSGLSDVFAVAIPIFHAFGRVGCFFAGCCYGAESEWGIAGRVIVADVRENVKRIPVQLIEAFLLLLLFSIMLWLFLKNRAKGNLIFVYLLIYAVMRFILEFIRGDEIRGRLLMFSTSQWISIITLLWVIAYLVIRKQRKDKE